MELSEQNVVIDVVETDIEGMGIEVSVSQAEADGYPSLDISLTNDTQQDLRISINRVLYNEGGKWKKCVAPSNFFLDGAWRVLSSKSVEISNDTQLDNQVLLTLSPWSGYHYMKNLGDYRLELLFQDDNGETVGIACVEWTQEVR